MLHAVDEQAVHDADLGGGQADPDRVVHQVAHAHDLLAQRVVEVLDRARFRAQHRVAELADMRERRRAPRRGLGIELGLLGSASRPASTSSSRASSAVVSVVESDTKSA